MPSSLSTPFLQYLEGPTDQQPYSKYKPVSQIEDILVRDSGGEAEWQQLVSGERRAIFACGSGMTACVGWLANEMLKQTTGGIKHVAVYDEVSTCMEQG